MKPLIEGHAFANTITGLSSEESKTAQSWLDSFTADYAASSSRLPNRLMVVVDAATKSDATGETT